MSTHSVNLEKKEMEKPSTVYYMRWSSAAMNAYSTVLGQYIHPSPGRVGPDKPRL
jgi:hypothetical protein